MLSIQMLYEARQGENVSGRSLTTIIPKGGSTMGRKKGGFFEKLCRMGKGSRAVLGIALVTALILGVVGYGMAAEKTVKIGILEPLSGPVAAVGKFELQAYQLAVDDVNAAGGVKALGGAKLELVLADTESKVEVGMAQVERLAGSDVVVILGAFQSGVTLPTTQVAEMKKIPYIVPMAVADAITERGFKYTFRACSTSKLAIERQAEFVYDYVAKLRPNIPMKTVALLYENSSYGESLAKLQKDMVKKYGKQLVADISYAATTSDVSSEVAKLKAADPDILLRTGYAADDLLVTKAMISMKYNPRFWLGFSGVGDASYIKGIPPQYMEDTIFLDPSSPKVPGQKDMVNRYIQRFGIDPSFSRSVYSIIWLVKDALERAGSVDREKMRDAISKTDIAPGEKGNIMPYRLMFDKNGQNTEAKYNAVQYKKDAFKVVWPKQWAEAELNWPWKKWEER
jgi:branched-chain amino acid transport system substrate-binding protein